MFIASSGLNNKAKDSDAALSIAISHIESFKVSASLSEYLSASAPEYGSEYEGDISVNFYYDGDWNNLGRDINDTAKYRLEMYISPVAQGNDNGGAGQLYLVRADVAYVSGDKDGETLASIQTKKYFPG